MCQFLENNQQQVSLMDKAVLEIGAGTGLLSIVASLLGKSAVSSTIHWVDHYICMFGWNCLLPLFFVLLQEFTL